MEISIHPLTVEQTRLLMPYFLSIDKNTPGEIWTATHFLFELPGKWDFSFFASCAEKPVTGFIIASVKENAVHIHRLAVDEVFRLYGVGKGLVEEVKAKAYNQQKKYITLKVAHDNISAINFYLKLNFAITGQVGSNYEMGVKLTN